MTTFNIIRLFLEVTQNTPERMAVVDQNGERKTSYGQLETMARKISSYITSKNLPESSFIPILLPAGVEYLAAELGIWMAGHAIVPLSRMFSPERINYIVKECEAVFVLDETELEKAMSHSPAIQNIEFNPKETCAMYYTSGSTGNPKGILHTYESLDFSVGIQGESFGCLPDDVFGSGAPFYFVASTFYFSFLKIGAIVHIFPDEVRKDVKMMEAYIEQNKITTSFISPSVLMNFQLQSDVLRTIWTGSERVGEINQGSYKIINTYGLTETAGPITFFELDKACDNVPIGKPGRGVKVHILDEDGNAVDVGNAGEICLEGIFTKGYYKMPEASECLYRGNVLHTGDIGMIREDGNLVYLNRNDWMVKINGQRVEPGEIEQAIKHIDGITNALVKGFTNDLAHIAA